jgi:hypothetical protein
MVQLRIKMDPDGGQNDGSTSYLFCGIVILAAFFAALALFITAFPWSMVGLGVVLLICMIVFAISTGGGGLG